MKKLFATLQQPIGKYLSEHDNLVAPGGGLEGLAGQNRLGSVGMLRGLG